MNIGLAFPDKAKVAKLEAENARLRKAIQWAADCAYAGLADDEIKALSEINNNCRAVLKKCPANLND